MSEKAARAAIEKMKTDDAFRARVMAKSDVGDRVRLLNVEGFPCSAEELDAVSSELTDEALDGVAGGARPGPCQTYCGGYGGCGNIWRK